jgi:hypothetical protein
MEAGGGEGRRRGLDATKFLEKLCCLITVDDDGHATWWGDARLLQHLQLSTGFASADSQGEREEDLSDFNSLMQHEWKGALRHIMAEPTPYRPDGRSRAFAYCVNAHLEGGDDTKPSSSSRSSRSSRSSTTCSCDLRLRGHAVRCPSFEFPKAPRSQDISKELCLPYEQPRAAPKPASEVSFRPSTKKAGRFRYRSRARLHRHRRLRFAGVTPSWPTSPKRRGTRPSIGATALLGR